MREFFTSVLKTVGLAFWVEIVTDRPECTYYFGPFDNRKDAEASVPGYVEDLQQEDATVVKSEVKRFRPQNLTIYDDKEDFGSKKPMATPVFSGQM